MQSTSNSHPVKVETTGNKNETVDLFRVEGCIEAVHVQVSHPPKSPMVMPNTQ